MPLTVTEVKNARPRERDYKLADERGLHLFVSRAGAKSWRFKYRFGDRERRMTFGLWPEVSLAEARERRDAARRVLRDGLDPAVEKEKARQAAIAAVGSTFKAAAEAWQEDQQPLWSPAHQKRARNRLEKDIYPSLGKLPIGDVTGPLVLTALRRIEARGSIETAKRVKGHIEAIMRRAKAEHLIDAAAVLAVADVRDALKPTPPASKMPSLTTIPGLIELQHDVDRSTSDAATKLASRLLALTQVRIGVLRTALWSEITGIDWGDPDAPAPDALWTIPAARMKLEVEDKGAEGFGHDVPLPPQAVEDLRALRVLTGQFDLLFPSAKSTRLPMSDAAVSSMYKRIRAEKYKGRMVPHGWRSAFSTLMNERAAELERDGDRLVIDMILAHVPKGVSSSEWAYNRARYLKPRRALLQAWADMITAGLPHPLTLIGQAAEDR